MFLRELFLHSRQHAPLFHPTSGEECVLLLHPPSTSGLPSSWPNSQSPSLFLSLQPSNRLSRTSCAFPGIDWHTHAPVLGVLGMGRGLGRMNVTLALGQFTSQRTFPNTEPHRRNTWNTAEGQGHGTHPRRSKDSKPGLTILIRALFPKCPGVAKTRTGSIQRQPALWS